MNVIKDYASVLDALAPALPDGYSAQNLFADMLRKRVFAVKHEQLVAAVQFVDDNELHVIAAAGKALTTDVLIHLAQFARRPVITACPKTPAHTRLYKRLGFVASGEELVWQA